MPERFSINAAIKAAAKVMEDALAGFEPALVSGEDAASVVTTLSRVVKLCAAAQVRAAARAAECGAHRREGFLHASDWLARKTGGSSGEAKAQIETAKALEDLSDTKEALTRGELSLAQAGEIAKTATECRGAEGELLALARGGESLKTLKERSRKLRLEARDRATLHERQRAARSFRHWVDDLGMVCGSFRLTPEVGTPIVNRLDTEADRVFRKAGREGRREPSEAYAADAFVTMLEGKGKTSSTRTDLVVLVDWPAIVRGHTEDGERCHIPGVGPVSVDFAREIAGDAFLSGVLYDGVDLTRMVRFGRHLSPELRLALHLGDAPGFDGVVCHEEGCDRRLGLEFDHVDPFANGGPTSRDNLRPTCKPHHAEKTERDRMAGLLGNGRRRGAKAGAGQGRQAPP